MTLAKWFHPEYFSDIDPVAMHKEMLQKFYGLGIGSLKLFRRLMKAFLKIKVFRPILR